MASPARDRRGAAPVSEDSTSVMAPAPPKARWFSGVAAMFRSEPPSAAAAESNANELFAFPSESSLRNEPGAMVDAPKPRPTPAATRLVPKRIIILALITGAGAAAGFALVTMKGVALPSFKGAAPTTGHLTINTQPAAAEVLVDGERRGVTPLTMALAAGPHTITIRTENDTRLLPMTIAAGADVTQNFELKARETAPLFGRISVVTDPPGAKVSIDGHAHGVAPLLIADLTAEEHSVTVANDGGSSERKVLVTSGGTASVVFSLTGKASGPVGGWLVVSSPFDVEVTENNDVIGASKASRIMLAAGRHDVMLTNRSLGFQEIKKVDVMPGKTTTLRIDPPQVQMSVNARPWAEIVMDGTSIGQTPIANVLVAIGTHEVVFRNPQLGDRKQTVLVTAGGPNRIAADLTK